MNKRYLILSACLAVLLVTAGVFGGYLYGTHKLTKEYDLKDQNLIKIIASWMYIQENHKDNETLDYKEVADHAIQGMVEGLNDKYAWYFPSGDSEFDRFLSAGFVGVGYSSDFDDDGSVIVTSVDSGSPAEKAGMMEGDVILRIDGIDVRGKGDEFFRSMTSREEGTHVIFTVLRDGKTIDLDTTIGWISLPNASYYPRDGVGIIWLTTFNEYTLEEFEDCLRQAEADHVSGIILDLLDNTGGEIDVAISIASCFLNEGDVVLTQEDHGVVVTHTATKTDIHTDLPVVILTSENTASSAEILLCALEEHGRAVSAGKTTYGKGTWNQSVYVDNSIIMISTGYWYTPNGNNVTGKGVTPDFEIPLVNDYYEWAVDYLTGTN